MVGLFRPHNTLKLLDVHFHSAYGHQTLQPGDLPWGPSNHSVTRPLSHVVLPGHVADFKRLYVHYLMATKLSSMVTYLDSILPIKPDDDIITWFCEITWQTKNIISILPQCLWPQKWQGGDIELGVPFLKVTRSFDQMILQDHVKYFSCCVTTTKRPMAN